ncbi:hypothetical protein F8S13_02820 [Chloroflexia bacterium SDU3-3]|nr:hypothetical protein F8S13_02820 [Chloroflexia bacterium SDU3-3]
MITIDSVRFDLRGWDVQHVSAARKIWTNDDGDMIIQDFIEAPPEYPYSLDNAMGLRRYMRALFGHDLDIVRFDIIPLERTRAIRMLLCGPNKDMPGNYYGGGLFMPFRDCEYVVHVICREGQLTGLREAVALDTVLAEHQGAPLPDLMEQARRLAYDERYDEQFPDHALSRWRRHLRAIEQSLALDAEARQLAPFTAERELRKRHDQPFERSPLTRIGYWLMVAASCLCVLASLFSWATLGGRTMGIPALVLQGAPIWLLAIPLLSVAILLLLGLCNRLDRYWIILSCSLPLIGLSILGAQVLGGNTLSGPGVYALFFSIVMHGILGLCMALAAPIPVLSLFANFNALGAASVFRQLHVLAQRRQWTYIDPIALPPCVRVDGEWGERPIKIMAGRGLLQAPSQPNSISIELVWRAPLAPLFVGNGISEHKPSRAEADLAQRIACRVRFGFPKPIFVWPSDGTTCSDAALEALRDVVESQRQFLRLHSGVIIQGSKLTYLHEADLMHFDAQSVQDVLAWLCQIAKTMEHHGLMGSSTRAAYPNENITPSQEPG